jgi:predicted nucleic acid-binding protein
VTAILDTSVLVASWKVPRRRVRDLDLVIAATANVEGAKLYTLNPAHFAGLEDLVEVVTPPA